MRLATATPAAFVARTKSSVPLEALIDRHPLLGDGNAGWLKMFANDLGSQHAAVDETLDL